MEQPSIPAVPYDDYGRRLHRELLAFILDDRKQTIRIAQNATEAKRQQAHLLAQGFGLQHRSVGNTEEGRSVECSKKGNLAPPVSHAGPPSTPHLARQPTKEEIRRILETFKSSTAVFYNFPTTLSSESRGFVHDIAKELELDSDSLGERGVDRYVRVTKVDEQTLRKRRQRDRGLNLAYHEYLEKLHQHAELEAGLRRPVIVLETPSDPAKPQNNALRLLQFNIEWMDYLFDPAAPAESPRFLVSNEKAEVTHVDDLCKRIAHLIESSQSDVVFVEEGPSTIERMRHFVQQYLGDAYEVFGGLENLTQQLYLLSRKGNTALTHLQTDDDALAFLSQPFFFDADGERTLSEMKFTRRPLVVRGKLLGQWVFFCVMHLKSKYVARGRSQWLSRTSTVVEQFVAKSISNRRRIQGECQRMREFISEVVNTKYNNPHIICAGDFNAGPGDDFFEQYYGMNAVLDSLLGSAFYGTTTLLPTLYASKPENFSCEFDDFIDGAPQKRCLVDHVFVSPSLERSVINAFVAHAAFQRTVQNGGRKRQERASDHRPVIVDIRMRE